MERWETVACLTWLRSWEWATRKMRWWYVGRKSLSFFFFLIRATSPFDLQTSMSVSIKPTSLPSLFNEPQPISSPVLDLQAGMCQLHSVESGLWGQPRSEPTTCTHWMKVSNNKPHGSEHHCQKTLISWFLTLRWIVILTSSLSF